MAASISEMAIALLEGGSLNVHDESQRLGLTQPDLVRQLGSEIAQQIAPITDQHASRVAEVVAQMPPGSRVEPIPPSLFLYGTFYPGGWRVIMPPAPAGDEKAWDRFTQFNRRVHTPKVADFLDKHEGDHVNGFRPDDVIFPITTSDEGAQIGHYHNDPGRLLPIVLAPRDASQGDVRIATNLLPDADINALVGIHEAPGFPRLIEDLAHQSTSAHPEDDRTEFFGNHTRSRLFGGLEHLLKDL